MNHDVSEMSFLSGALSLKRALSATAATLAGLVLLFVFAGCEGECPAGECVEGRVIDKKEKRPIPGIVLYCAAFGSHYTHHDGDATDGDGAYRIWYSRPFGLVSPTACKFVDEDGVANRGDFIGVSVNLGCLDTKAGCPPGFFIIELTLR